jgi:hypothetical protein
MGAKRAERVVLRQVAPRPARPAAEAALPARKSDVSDLRTETLDNSRDPWGGHDADSMDVTSWSSPR